MPLYPLSRTVYSWFRPNARLQRDLISFRSRGFAMVLVVCLLSSSTPAAPRTIVDVANATSVTLKFWYPNSWRSEEHTSELQSRLHLVCRLLLEKKKKR